MLKIQVLGTGCKKCNLLSANVEAVAQELGVVYEIEKVSDINEITDMGVMITPALVINGAVVLSGKSSSEGEIKALLHTIE
ncbi:MAG: thioredoxin family protein [Gammaproteobacteria bacterium]|nr:MAG: thioredoxin family protein [Gammaproteobacteria bacterium]